MGSGVSAQRPGATREHVKSWERIAHPRTFCYFLVTKSKTSACPPLEGQRPVTTNIASYLITNYYWTLHSKLPRLLISTIFKIKKSRWRSLGFLFFVNQFFAPNFFYLSLCASALSQCPSKDGIKCMQRSLTLDFFENLHFFWFSQTIPAEHLDIMPGIQKLISGLSGPISILCFAIVSSFHMLRLLSK